MQTSLAIALSALLAAPLLAGCTVNTTPATPVVVQERVVAPPQVVTPPPVIMQRY
ncbi:MAG: hypothetical protein K5Q68_03145 [Roseococcus sp.]|nr:hypothetical protein [Roseococcus sp.]